MVVKSGPEVNPENLLRTQRLVEVGHPQTAEVCPAATLTSILILKNLARDAELKSRTN